MRNASLLQVHSSLISSSCFSRCNRMVSRVFKHLLHPHENGFIIFNHTAELGEMETSQSVKA